MKGKSVYFVLPCYNEELCLSETYNELNKKVSFLKQKGKIEEKSRIVFVDDGSHDDTWKVISELSKKHEDVIGLKLSHNVGHQNALLAGLLYSVDFADAIISMDADLQDDLSVIDGFLEAFNLGDEIVYGVRKSRKKDTFFKRWTAQCYYKIMKKMGVELIYNAADCRLMTQRAVRQLGKYSEVNLFLRGIVPLIGLKTSIVEYERNERLAGESKYSLRKMLSFAWEGVTSFSTKPIVIILKIGVLILLISLFVMICAEIVKLAGGLVDGWVFVVSSIWLIAGVQMVSLGVVGEYMGKIYAESKRRPRFYIDKIIKKGKEING